jgi:holo-[acyl-carrier protein] synthase
VIVGVGVDLVEIARIEGALARWGDRFLDRILGPEEVLQARAVRHPARFLAKRFAAKEAAAKALHTGMQGGVTFTQILVSHSAVGAPRLALCGRAAEVAAALGAARLHLTISDERTHAVAVVVLET